MDLRRRALGLDLSTTLKVNILTLILPTTVSRQTLWALLTEPDELVRWSPFVPDRIIESIGDLTAKEREGDTPYVSRIIEYEPLDSLAHTWGDDVVRWVLADESLRCEMTLARPEYASYYAAGWQVCLAVLQALLEGEEQERTVGEDAMKHGWVELQEHYLHALPAQEPVPEIVGD